MWEKENNMERIILSDNINFSRLIYGMWRLTDDKDTSIEHIKKKISLCLDQGITTFDQADIYGDYSAEELFEHLEQYHSGPGRRSSDLTGG